MPGVSRCCLPRVVPSPDLQRDPVDRGRQLLVLRVQVSGSGGQALVVHEHPDGLQVLTIGQKCRGERVPVMPSSA